MRNPRFRAALTVILLLFPLAAFAASGEEAAPEHESSGSGFVPKVINFVVLFGALFFFLRKPLGAMLTKKTDVVRDILDDARKERDKAESKLVEAKERASALENEAARLKAEAAAEGEAETQRIRELSVLEATRIKTLATQEVAGQLKAGIRELKEFTAELAAGLAEERIKQRLTGADQSALIDRSINRLKAIHGEPTAH